MFVQKKSLIYNLIYVAVGVIAIVLLWTLLAVTQDKPLLFPTVGQILQQMFSLLGSVAFYSAVFNTLLRCILAFVLAIVIAFVLVLTVAVFPAVGRIQPGVGAYTDFSTYGSYGLNICVGNAAFAYNQQSLVRKGKAKYPTETAMVVDYLARPVWDTAAWGYGPRLYADCPVENIPYWFRHSGGINLIYMDGHAAYLTNAQCKYRFSTGDVVRWKIFSKGWEN